MADYPTSFEDTEIGNRKIRQIQTTEGYFIARLDSGGYQTIGELVGGSIYLGKVEGGVHKSESRLSRKSASTVFQNH